MRISDWSSDVCSSDLVALGLADADPAREVRRNFLLAPDSSPGDDSESIVLRLIAHLDDLPQLPSKIGIAIDAGPAPCLAGVPADFRFERSQAGALLLRVEGRPMGSRSEEHTSELQS